MRLVIASRQSDLARIQAYAVGDALRNKNPDLQIEYFFRESLGDKNLSDPLWKMPERGVFTEDFHKGLLDGEFDIVVHSWKDLPVEDRVGSEIIATLKREDMRDLLLIKKSSLTEKNLKIFTSSPRRTYNLSRFLKELLPMAPQSLEFHPVRGNVQTRIRKLMESSSDGLVVAKAALDRLLSADRGEFQNTKEFVRNCLSDLNWMVLPLSLNPTAAAQGALAVEAKAGRADLHKLFQDIHCPVTFETVQEERRTLKGWGGGCHQKIGIAVLKRPYGKVVFAQGVRDSGESIDRYELVRDFKMKSGSAYVDEVPWFDRVELPFSIPQGVDAHFISKAEALPKSFIPKPGDLVWTSGLAAWRALAGRGIWVHGSNESLGEVEDLRVEVLDGHTRSWAKWTHEGGTAGPLGLTVKTYKLVPKSPVPVLNEKDEHFYWKSGSSFELALSLYPWLKNKSHWTGPGHTYDAVSQRLAEPHIALTHEQWQKLIKQGKKP